MPLTMLAGGDNRSDPSLCASWSCRPAVADVCMALADLLVGGVIGARVAGTVPQARHTAQDYEVCTSAATNAGMHNDNSLPLTNVERTTLTARSGLRCPSAQRYSRDTDATRLT